MKKLLGTLALSLGLYMGLFAGTAHAADVARLYGGLGLADGTVEVPGASDRSFGTLNATVGLQFLDYIGIELQLGSASDQTNSVVSEPLVTYQAALLRLGYRWDRFGVYAVGGQARMDIDDSINPTDSGNALGFGIDLFGNETTSLNFNVLRLDGGAFTAATIGFRYYFGGFR